jgi:hypothetical protein
MLPRTTLLAALAAAALASGGASTATVVLQSSDTGAAKSAPHTTAAHAHESDAGDEAGTDENAGPSADVTPPPCPADVKNHGAYVSSVAKSAAHGKGANHGALVSAAAKSDCGKDATKASDGSDADENETDNDDATETTAPKTANPNKPAKPGKSTAPHGKPSTVPSQAHTTS